MTFFMISKKSNPEWDDGREGQEKIFGQVFFGWLTVTLMSE